MLDMPPDVARRFPADLAQHADEYLEGRRKAP